MLQAIQRPQLSLRRYIDQALPFTHFLVHQIRLHQGTAILTVIALEEIGVPLPLPGDVFIMYAGHLVARGRISLVSAFLTIVVGSMIGASVLYWLSRRYGQPFVKKYGPFMHIKQARLDRVERWFVAWGPLVIVVGRQIPGFRMVISVFSGLFGVRYPVFLGSVAVAAAMWAAMFLALGIHLDSQIGPYMTITPLHLLPSTLFITASIIYGMILKHRADAAERRAAAQLAPSEASST
jgi:membrane protein DedA with SNARE-associated domain